MDSGLARNREWIYLARVQGRFQRIHRWSGLVLQALLFVTPWVLVGGNPALHIDLPARRLHALGATFSANETFYLVLIGLILVFSLFFFTALYGRLWCGYLCPQTVFLEEWIRRLEAWIEGDATKRRRRDAGPWTLDKAWRKGAKWTSFLLVAVVLSMTLVSYFAGARSLWTGSAGTVDYLFVGVLSAGWFLDFAWFREQLCNYVCPYARFQGALTDDESQVIAYRVSLGEPRKGSEGVDKAALGACVNCRKCVEACPQGIDIREGFQLECVTCGRCADACTPVMAKFGQASLIEYTTIAETEGRKARPIRPRTVAYGAILATLVVSFGWSLHERHETQVFCDRTPGSLFQVDPDGAIRNTYLLKIINNHAEQEPTAYAVTVKGLEGAEVIVPAIRVTGEGGMVTVPLVVRIPAEVPLPSTVPLRIHVDTDDDHVVVEGTFKTPGTKEAS